MAKDLFSFDTNIEDEFDSQIKTYDSELKKAKIYCVRGQYDKAEAIYNMILEEDMENEDAYVGLLRVHSEDFSKFEGDEIERDIKTIEALFPDIENEEYIDYIARRKKYYTTGTEQEIKVRTMRNIEDILEEADNLFEKESYSDAYSYYERAAQLGSGTAMMRMGYLAYGGYGVNRDSKAAMKLYEQAINAGEYYACYLLGLIYMNDLGQDAKAVKYFEMGYLKGQNRSCAASLGYCYMYGKGVTKDYEMAFKYLSIGLEAEPSFTVSCLAYLYENGYGTEKDLEKAMDLYRRAAEEFGDEYAKGRIKALTARGIFSWIIRH